MEFGELYDLVVLLARQKIPQVPLDRDLALLNHGQPTLHRDPLPTKIEFVNLHDPVAWLAHQKTP